MNLLIVLPLCFNAAIGGIAKNSDENNSRNTKSPKHHGVLMVGPMGYGTDGDVKPAQLIAYQLSQSIPVIFIDFYCIPISNYGEEAHVNLKLFEDLFGNQPEIQYFGSRDDNKKLPIRDYIENQSAYSNVVTHTWASLTVISFGNENHRQNEVSLKNSFRHIQSHVIDIVQPEVHTSRSCYYVLGFNALAHSLENSIWCDQAYHLNFGEATGNWSKRYQRCVAAFARYPAYITFRECIFS